MQKSTALLIFFAVLALYFPFAAQSADIGAFSSGTAILTSDHKFSPKEERLSAVRRRLAQTLVVAPGRRT